MKGLRYSRRTGESPVRLAVEARRLAAACGTGPSTTVGRPTADSSAVESLCPLACDLSDEIEVLVLVQDDEASALGDGCNEEIRN